MLGLTYDLEVGIHRGVVHHCLCCAGVATLVPDLHVHDFQVAAAFFTLTNREEGRKERKKEGRRTQHSLTTDISRDSREIQLTIK